MKSEPVMEAELKFNKQYKELKDFRRGEAKKFREKNKKVIMILDILVILCLIFNVGALTITNTMVTKVQIDQGIEVEFVEVNPVPAKIYDYKPAPIDKNLLAKVGLHLFLLPILIIIHYLYLYCWIQT